MMPRYNLIEYEDNYLETSGILWQYCRDETVLNYTNNNIPNSSKDNATTNSFKIEQEITG